MIEPYNKPKRIVHSNWIHDNGEGKKYIIEVTLSDGTSFGYQANINSLSIAKLRTPNDLINLDVVKFSWEVNHKYDISKDNNNRWTYP